MLALQITSDTYGRCAASESGVRLSYMRITYLVYIFRGAVGAVSDGG